MYVIYPNGRLYFVAMNIQDIPLAFHGSSLGQARSRMKEKRRYLADGFIYEQTINMMAADPGTGKSTVAAQIAVEMAGGYPVFGLFETPRPLNVLFAQTERSILEFFERLELISKAREIREDHLFVTEEYQKFNLLVPEHAELFIECVKRDCPNMDIIFLDPIYCMVSGGLKEDKQASMFTKVMSILQKETGAVLFYNHHTTKTTYDRDGQKIAKDDPFYGSQWLKAHVTGSFHLQECDGGVELVKKKDNYGLLPDRVVLEYNAETGICQPPLEELNTLEKVKAFLRRRELDKRSFYFSDLQRETKLCTRILRAQLNVPQIKERLILVSSIKNKNLYQVNGFKNQSI